MVSEPIYAGLRAIVGDTGVITDPVRLLVYESDGLTAYRRPPKAVVLPSNTDEVRDVLRLLQRSGAPFVPRGAGTGLSGGCLAGPDAYVVGTARMNKILDIDRENRTARVQPGVVNAHLTEATRPYGLYYAPDPSSQSTCTLGGNVAENSGGPHCLKYGVTSRYVTGLTVVLPSGEVVELGGFGRPCDLDLVGLFVGSEGNFGIATEIETRLLPLPESVRTLLAIFDRVEDAGRAVTTIIAEGLLPAALEIIDGPTIRAVEASVFAAGYPVDAGAALVIEFDGLEAGLDHESALARRCCLAAGATDVSVATSDEDRAALWRGRKKAFGAMGRIAPDLLVQDATVPRTRLPEVLGRIEDIGARYELKVANVFHAGDGNLHPNILFDRRDEAEVSRVEAASQEIMQACVDVGGTITGEHGVGLDKRGYMHLIHRDATLDAMATVQRVFDPDGRSNPGKVLPDDVWARASAPVPRERSPRSEVTLDDLRAALPSGTEISPAGVDWPTPGGHPTAVVFPRDADEAAEILRAASKTGIRVGPAGQGRWLSAWGLGYGRPGPVDLVVSASAMNEVRAYEPADLTVTAGAGLTLETLAELTLANRQYLAVDASPEGTLGGLVATASVGPLRSGFGETRDHVLGLTLVTGDGRVLELGGRVVKNVAGFDLLKLAVGSWGTIGLITEVTVRLHPAPQSDVSMVWQAERASELVGVARSLATASLVPHALELIVNPGDGARDAEGSGGSGSSGPAPAALMLRVLGTPDTVAESVHVFRNAAGRPPDSTLEGGESKRMSAAVRSWESAGSHVRIWRRPAELEELAAFADGAKARAAIHVTEGLLRMDWDIDADAQPPQAWMPVEEDPDRVRLLRGSPIGASTADPRRSHPAVQNLVRGLRAAFDPMAVLWPKGDDE